MSKICTSSPEPVRDPKQDIRSLRPGPNRQSHKQAMASTFAQYDKAMRVLAATTDTPSTPTRRVEE